MAIEREQKPSKDPAFLLPLWVRSLRFQNPGQNISKAVQAANDTAEKIASATKVAPTQCHVPVNLSCSI